MPGILGGGKRRRPPWWEASRVHGASPSCLIMRSTGQGCKEKTSVIVGPSDLSVNSDFRSSAAAGSPPRDKESRRAGTTHQGMLPAFLPSLSLLFEPGERRVRCYCQPLQSY